MVGAGDVLDQEHFWLWCKTVFGHLENAQFAAQMRQLVVAQEQAGQISQIRSNGRSMLAAMAAAMGQKDKALQFDLVQVWSAAAATAAFQFDFSEQSDAGTKEEEGADERGSGWRNRSACT